MAIRFNSSERPTRIAKSVMQVLRSSGETIPLGRLRAALARVFGYRSWNDVLARSSTGTPFDGDVDSWHADTATILILELGISPETATEAALVILQLVRPSDWSWEVAAARIGSRVVLASTRPVEAIEHDGMRGFRVSMDIDGYGPYYMMVVSDDGTDLAFGVGNRDGKHDSARKDLGQRSGYEESLGPFLARYGLLSGRREDVDGGLVTETLQRLDGDAIGMLKAVEYFGVSAYKQALTVKEGSPFDLVVRQMPLMASVVVRLAHAIDLGHDEVAETTRAILDAASPLELFIQEVDTYGRKHWPDRKASTDSMRMLLEGMTTHGNRSMRHLDPWNVAVLGHCPAHMMPKTPEAIDTAIRFGDLATSYLAQTPMAGAALFVDLKGPGAASWAEHLDLEDKASILLTSITTDAANAVIRQMAADEGLVGDEVDECIDTEASKRIETALQPHLFEGRGMADLFKACSACYALGADNEQGQLAFSWLTSSGVMPESLRGLDASALLEAIGLDGPELISSIDDGSGPGPA